MLYKLALLLRQTYTIIITEMFYSILRVILRHLPLIVIPVLYLIFQVFRFETFVMFAIMMVECSVFHNETTIDCYTSTTCRSPGCGPYCWKGMWVGCSTVICIIWLFVLCVPIVSKHIREIRPASNASNMRSLVVKPYFWALKFTVAIVVVYDAIVPSQEHVRGSEEAQVEVILSNLLTTAVTVKALLATTLVNDQLQLRPAL